VWRFLTKRFMSDGSSGWAQGGIAAVLGEGDTFESHVDDTLVAGAGLSDLEATRFVVEHAPESIAWLRQLGVPFSQEEGQLHLTREGGHSARRIVHVTDATGAAVQRTLIETVRRTPNIEVFEQHTAGRPDHQPQAGRAVHAEHLPGPVRPGRSH
jgi:L-aspartate oxidase